MKLLLRKMRDNRVGQRRTLPAGERVYAETLRLMGTDCLRAREEILFEHEISSRSLVDLSRLLCDTSAALIRQSREQSVGRFRSGGLSTLSPLAPGRHMSILRLPHREQTSGLRRRCRASSAGRFAISRPTLKERDPPHRPRLGRPNRLIHARQVPLWCLLPGRAVRRSAVEGWLPLSCRPSATMSSAGPGTGTRKAAATRDTAQDRLNRVRKNAEDRS
jgi:hypothetical protein